MNKLQELKNLETAGHKGQDTSSTSIGSVGVRKSPRKGNNVSVNANTGPTEGRKTRKSSGQQPTPANASVSITSNETSAVGGSCGKKRNPREIFTGKRFYLDLKTRSLSSLKVRQLIEDLSFFGGSIEDFFSNDVSIVISDAPEWKLRHPYNNTTATCNFNGVLQPQSPLGDSPGGPPSTMTALAQSPWSPVTMQDLNSKRRSNSSRSRVDTILERARQQAKGSSDVIETAHKLNIKVWSVMKIIDWLTSFRAKFGFLTQNSVAKKLITASTSSIPQPTNKASFLAGVESGTVQDRIKREVKVCRSHSFDSGRAAGGVQVKTFSPDTHYIKYESTCFQYRPVFHVFRRFPQIFLGGRFGTSPFCTRDSLRNSAAAATLALATAANNNASNAACSTVKSTAAPSTAAASSKRPLKDITSKEQNDFTAPPPSKMAKRSTVVERNEDSPVVSVSAQNAPNRHGGVLPMQQKNTAVKTEQNGFCEICHRSFTNLEAHVQSEIHQHLININSYWSKLDLCIGLVNMNSDDSTHEFSGPNNNYCSN